MKPELLSVAGTTVECLRLVGGGTCDIVLLHEGLGCIELWRDFPQQLARSAKANVIAYSRAGYGKSDAIRLPRPLDYMGREARDFLPAFLNRLELHQPILLGHSDGATIALEFAAAFPQALSGLVLMAPHVFVEQISIDAIGAANAAYARGTLKDKLKRYHGTNVDNAFRGWCDSWLDPAFRAWDIRSKLHDIEVPMLLLQGINDEYGTVSQIESIETTSGGEVRSVIFPNCGHAPHQDKLDETLQEIVKFTEALNKRQRVSDTSIDYG